MVLYMRKISMLLMTINFIHNLNHSNNNTKLIDTMARAGKDKICCCTHSEDV